MNDRGAFDDNSGLDETRPAAGKRGTPVPEAERRAYPEPVRIFVGEAF